jgi:phage FluMu protein Com
MKSIKCNKCGKFVDVEDVYCLKRCPDCRIKDEAYLIKKRELKKLDREAQKQIKDLGLQKAKLSPIFKDYSTYAQNYQKLFKVTPSFDDYLTALRQEKIRLAYDERDRIRRERKRKSTVFPDENWGSEPQTILKPQYPKEHENLGANCFGSESDQATNLSHYQTKISLKACLVNLPNSKALC